MKEKSIQEDNLTVLAVFAVSISCKLKLTRLV
jgi:hypothetical protein